MEVSKGLFWKQYAGTSTKTSVEQSRSMQQLLCLVRTFSWLVSQPSFILKVACTHAFIPVFFLFSHSCRQLCMLDNTALFPVALFLLMAVVVFFLAWFVSQSSEAV